MGGKLGIFLFFFIFFIIEFINEGMVMFGMKHLSLKLTDAGKIARL